MFNRFRKINNVNLFYREAGNRKNPTIVLLHGYPSSSSMFRTIIPTLAEHFHVLAPDFPGFGFTESPALESFEYSFDSIANTVNLWLEKLEIETYFLCMQDYGAPIGFRIAQGAPEKVLGLIVQNGNAYQEGLTEAWAGIQKYWQDKSTDNANALLELCSPDFIQHMYINGTSNPEAIAPESWTLDSHFLASEVRQAIQIELFHNYQTNVENYPLWQDYFRTHQPATLVVWGLNDMFFSKVGAESFKKDLDNIEYHYYNTGHFALEEFGQEISQEIVNFCKNQ